MSSNTLSFLLSGPGLIGRKHAELIQANPRFDLSVIVAPNSDRNQDYARQQGAKLYSDMDHALAAEAIDGGAIDGVIISSPNAFHYDQAMACVAHGMPVLVEKPLTDKIKDAADLGQAANAAGVPVLVGHHRTYNPLLQTARAFLSSAAFGNLVCVRGSALFYKPDDYFEAGPWRTKTGGGPILINLIHEIGILRYLCGEITSVTAIESKAARGFEVEDSAAVLFRFANGAIGTFLLSDSAASSKSWEMTSGENPAYPHSAGEDCYHFAGDMGSLDFPTLRTRSYASPEDRSWWKAFQKGQLTVPNTDPLAAQLDHFADVIQGTATPMVTAQDGYANMLVLEAIKTSAATQETVHLTTSV